MRRSSMSIAGPRRGLIGQFEERRLVEPRGFEPLTSSLRILCREVSSVSPRCPDADKCLRGAKIRLYRDFGSFPRNSPWWSPCGHQTTMVASLVAGQNRQKLTKRIVQAAQLGNERYTIWDTALAGFGVRIAPSGLRTFILRYRLPGNSSLKRYVTIGRFGPITVDQARARAKTIIGGVASHYLGGARIS